MRLFLALALAAGAVQAQRVLPEGGLAIGVSSTPCSGNALGYSGYYGNSQGTCARGQLLGRAALAISPFVTAGVRQIGYLDRNTFAWGSTGELRLNLPLGAAVLFVSAGAGLGAAQQFDPAGNRGTGVGLYQHLGGGLRLRDNDAESGSAFVELAIETQRWQHQDRLAQGGGEEHVSLSRPFFSLAVGFTPGF